MFRAVAGVPAAISALLLVVWLLTNSTFYDARDSLIAAGVGLLIYFGYSFLRKDFGQDKGVSDDDIVRETHS
jgi:hypothetical protein